jgi:hypothetical protein
MEMDIEVLSNIQEANDPIAKAGQQILNMPANDELKQTYLGQT